MRCDSILINKTDKKVVNGLISLLSFTLRLQRKEWKLFKSFNLSVRHPFSQPKPHVLQTNILNQKNVQRIKTGNYGYLKERISEYMYILKFQKLKK